MNDQNSIVHLGIEELLAGLPGPDGERHRTAFERGSLRAVVYAPRGEDPQRPHEQDEIYVVIEGAGELVSGANRRRFSPGDALFVPAGLEHRFEGFSDDLVVWAIFVGER